jgi:hypothetical protein
MKSRLRKDYKPNNDYYTPDWIFEKLNLQFDLDVCAPTGGVAWIPATNHFDIKTDGLKQNWYGLVWCNPPFSDPKPFIDKFVAHSNGVMLTQISRSKSFKLLWETSDAVIILPGSLKFYHATEGLKQIFMPCALFGYGKIASSAMINSKIGKVR